MQCTSCHNKSALVSSPADAPVMTLRLTTTITCTLRHWDTCSRVQSRQYRNIPTQQISPVVISNYARPWPHAATRVTCTQSGGATQTLAPMIQCYPMLSTARCGQCGQCQCGQCGHDPAAVCHMSTVHSHLSVQISGCKYPLTAGTSDPTRGSQLRSKIV